MKWLEVSLLVDEELAEPVAEIIGRHAPGGVVLSQADPARSMVDVRGYLSDDAQLDDVRAKLEHDLWFLGRIRHLPEPVFAWLEEADWAEAWKTHFNPLLVGQRLRIQPAWLPRPDDERLTILIDPGMAFGTGSHPTTQLCLELLEERVGAGDWVADLGCGSGVLSIAAVRLGAAGCLALDTDPQAVSICQQNALVNGVDGQISTRLGSLEALILEARLRPQRWIVANIYLSALQDMLGHGLASICDPLGGLILSGILAEQEAELTAAAEASGLRVAESRSWAEWRALILTNEEKPLPEQGAESSQAAFDRKLKLPLPAHHRAS